MLILPAVLTLSIEVNLSLTSLLRYAQQPRGLVCGIATVGYRFHGLPGLKFVYANDEYEIPAEGVIELIADRRHTTYRIENRTLPLDVWPRDPFGFRDIPVRASSPAP